MARTIADIVAALTPDSRRSQIGFEPDFAVANNRMLDAKAAEIPEILREWLSRHQPCLFGRIAAKKDLLSFCILGDDDIARGDEAVRDTIQAARLQWKKDAHLGRKSGFIVLAVSRKVGAVCALPKMSLSPVTDHNRPTWDEALGERTAAHLSAAALRDQGPTHNQ